MARPDLSRGRLKTMTRTIAAPAVLLLVALLGMPHRAAADAPDFLYGSPIPADQAHRAIALGPGTRWVNVVQGETVRFVLAGGSFGWRFDGPGSRPVDLQRVAPPGLLTHPVTAYVTFPGEFSRSQF